MTQQHQDLRLKDKQTNADPSTTSLPRGSETTPDDMTATLSRPLLPISSGSRFAEAKQQILPEPPTHDVSPTRRTEQYVQFSDIEASPSSATSPWLPHGEVQPDRSAGLYYRRARDQTPRWHRDHKMFDTDAAGPDTSGHELRQPYLDSEPSRSPNVNNTLPRSSFAERESHRTSVKPRMTLAAFASSTPAQTTTPVSYSSATSAAIARAKLHFRQQPRAARAGPDGKDRRTIDPPPILQLLIDDFDPQSDLSLLKAGDWVVHARLISAQSPHEDMMTIPNMAENSREQKRVRLLLGTNVASSWFCPDDPDPVTAPKHPVTRRSPPPSPSMRFIKTSKNDPSKAKDPDAYKTFPGAFFIFADISVRKAGEYRLEFRLMKMDQSVLHPGTVVPTTSIAISDVFKVVNAKDFDQVHPSTNLVKGLLDRGARYPLKLKKGYREGQRRRLPAEDSESEGDEDDDNEDDSDEDAYPGDRD